MIKARFLGDPRYDVLKDTLPALLFFHCVLFCSLFGHNLVLHVWKETKLTTHICSSALLVHELYIEVQKKKRW